MENEKKLMPTLLYFSISTESDHFSISSMCILSLAFMTLKENGAVNIQKSSLQFLKPPILLYTTSDMGRTKEA